MDLKQAIFIIIEVQSAFATIKHIFNINGQKENTNLIEIDGVYVPSVSDDYMLFCEESELVDYLAEMAGKRFADEYDPDFLNIFSFENIDKNLFEEAEKTIIKALHLSEEEIIDAPALIGWVL